MIQLPLEVPNAMVKILSNHIQYIHTVTQSAVNVPYQSTMYVSGTITYILHVCHIYNTCAVIYRLWTGGSLAMSVNIRDHTTLGIACIHMYTVK